MEGISFVIPNFNGENLLKENLPYLLSEIKEVKNKEIIVADDGSTDNSLNMLKMEFPMVSILTSNGKRGFSENCNRGIFNAKYNIICCLNSDVRVGDNFLNPLLSLLKDDVFAVGPKILRSADGKDFNESIHKSFYSFGLFYNSGINGEKILREEPAFPLPFACGAAVLFKKDKFVELGGFDTIYSPFYWEDFDLSYRAWKRGWKVLYNPKSIVYHRHRGTILRFHKLMEVETILERNRFLFVWKNITDPILTIEHFLFLPIKLLEALLQGRGFFINSFIMASRLFKEAWSKRQGERKKQKIGDREVLNIYKKAVKNFTCKP